MTHDELKAAYQAMQALCTQAADALQENIDQLVESSTNPDTGLLDDDVDLLAIESDTDLVARLRAAAVPVMRAQPALVQQPATLDEMHAIGNGIMYGEQPAPVQGLPFGVGGGLVAIKTLLGRDPCVHANTAIEMIDAILKEHSAAQPAVQEGRDWSLLEATQESLREHMAEITRLKAAQPAVPLTDEQIVQLSLEWPAETNDWASHIDFARAVEATHGITKGGAA
jgi:hypothetical protein